MEAAHQCSKCQTSLEEGAIFCNSCGYPEGGTEEDKAKYYHSIKLKKDIVEDGHKKMKSVRILLMVLAGFNVAFGLFYLTDPLTFADAIGSFIAAGLFLGCIIWVNKQPLTGVIAAFMFWILLQLSVVLVDPALLFNGILLKIIFIGIFIKGISSAKDAKKYTGQLKEMNAI